jgi:hypothetical protein
MFLPFMPGNRGGTRTRFCCFDIDYSRSPAKNRQKNRQNPAAKQPIGAKPYQLLYTKCSRRKKEKENKRAKSDCSESDRRSKSVQEARRSRLIVSFLPSYLVWHWAEQFLVHPPRPQQRRVNEVRPRGGGQDKDARAEALDAVQLGQELVYDAISDTRAVVAASEEKRD